MERMRRHGPQSRRHARDPLSTMTKSLVLVTRYEEIDSTGARDDGSQEMSQTLGFELNHSCQSRTPQGRPDNADAVMLTFISLMVPPHNKSGIAWIWLDRHLAQTQEIIRHR